MVVLVAAQAAELVPVRAAQEPAALAQVVQVLVLVVVQEAPALAVEVEVPETAQARAVAAPPIPTAADKALPVRRACATKPRRAQTAPRSADSGMA